MLLTGGACRGLHGAAFARAVVDFDAGLVVVGVDAEMHVVVLHGQRFHENTACDQLVALENGRYPVEHMVLGLLDVVGDHVFKGQHALHIQIACAGDKVFLVCVFARELIADQMTAVVEIVPVHVVVFGRLPARGLDLADAAAFFRGHEIRTDAGVGHAAAAERVQFTVSLKGDGRVVGLGEIGVVAVDGDVGRAGELRQRVEGENVALGGHGLRRRGGRLRRNERAGRKQQRTQEQCGNQAVHLA